MREAIHDYLEAMVGFLEASSRISMQPITSSERRRDQAASFLASLGCPLLTP